MTASRAIVTEHAYWCELPGDHIGPCTRVTESKMTIEPKITLAGDVDPSVIAQAFKDTADAARLASLAIRDLGMPVIVNRWMPSGMIMDDGTRLYASSEIAGNLFSGDTPMPGDRSNDRGRDDEADAMNYNMGLAIASQMMRDRYPGPNWKEGDDVKPVGPNQPFPSAMYSSIDDKAQPWAGQVHAVDGRVWGGKRWIGVATVVDEARSNNAQRVIFSIPAELINAGESARDAVARMATKYVDDIDPDGIPYKLSADPESPYYWKRLFGDLEMGVYCNGILVKNLFEVDRRAGLVRFDEVNVGLLNGALPNEQTMKGNIEIAFSGARPRIRPEDLLASELDGARIAQERIAAEKRRANVDLARVKRELEAQRDQARLDRELQRERAQWMKTGPNGPVPYTGSDPYPSGPKPRLMPKKPEREIPSAPKSGPRARRLILTDDDI